MAIADFGYGAVRGLEDLVAARMQAQMQAAQIAEMQAQQEARLRQLAQGDERIGLDRAQFDYTKSQDAAQSQAAAGEAAAFEEYVSSLPGHLQQPAKGRRFGLNIKPEDIIEAPETRAASDARTLARVQAEAAARANEAIRVKRTPGAEAPAAPRTQLSRGIDPATGQAVTRLIDMNTGKVLTTFPAGMSAEEMVVKIQQEAAARERGKAEGKANDDEWLGWIGGLFGGDDDAGGGPAIGEIRLINGQRARWDGQGWLPAGS